ncbi:pro-Pol polyprotein [Trichonephila clavipes]|nr:pro-Pol polyprotein [Trichonephila clavipes]
MDQHSRWPEAIPLKSLTAKSTCEALLEIFSRTGISEVIVMDNETYFTASLTQEFLKILGACPRFSTPYHPERNGLIERWKQTLSRTCCTTLSERKEEVGIGIYRFYYGLIMKFQTQLPVQHLFY